MTSLFSTSSSFTFSKLSASRFLIPVLRYTSKEAIKQYLSSNLLQLRDSLKKLVFRHTETEVHKNFVKVATEIVIEVGVAIFKLVACRD